MDRALPLAGIRVLDCSRVYAGPIASMILGDLGAEIWKVEPPDGDETRGWGPPYWGDPADRRSAYFASVNRNKRSLVVNFKTDGGRTVLDRLAAHADLLLHNYQPSVAAKLGLDADRLRTEFPHLVVATLGGFPGSGAAAERPAYDLVAQAVSGLMSVTGEPDGVPMKVGVALLDLTAGLQAAIGALAGLLARERGRPGTTHASVSLIEAGVTSLTNVLGYYLATGEEPRRWGTGHPDIVPYQVFAARDGHLVVAVGNDAQFGHFLSVLGLPWDDRYATNTDRLARRDELVPLLAARIGERRRDELVSALSAADVPAGPVNTVSEALAAMEAAHDGWTQEAEGMRLAPDPIRVDGERLPLRAAPPRLGDGTDAILGEVGFSPEEIAALRADGAIG
ncbi:MAG: CaiB/BaiF CoA transferase family protein [Candidatus Limnocylindria bacterium]